MVVPYGDARVVLDKTTRPLFASVVPSAHFSMARWLVQSQRHFDDRWQLAAQRESPLKMARWLAQSQRHCDDRLQLAAQRESPWQLCLQRVCLIQTAELEVFALVAAPLRLRSVLTPYGCGLAASDSTVGAQSCSQLDLGLSGAQTQHLLHATVVPFALESSLRLLVHEQRSFRSIQGDRRLHHEVLVPRALDSLPLFPTEVRGSSLVAS